MGFAKSKNTRKLILVSEFMFKLQIQRSVLEPGPQDQDQNYHPLHVKFYTQHINKLSTPCTDSIEQRQKNNKNKFPLKICDSNVSK